MNRESVQKTASSIYKGQSPLVWYAMIEKSYYRAFVINRENKEMLLFSEPAKTADKALANLSNTMIKTNRMFR